MANIAMVDGDWHCHCGAQHSLLSYDCIHPTAGSCDHHFTHCSLFQAGHSDLNLPLTGLASTATSDSDAAVSLWHREACCTAMDNNTLSCFSCIAALASGDRHSFTSAVNAKVRKARYSVFAALAELPVTSPLLRNALLKFAYSAPVEELKDTYSERLKGQMVKKLCSEEADSARMSAESLLHTMHVTFSQQGAYEHLTEHDKVFLLSRFGILVATSVTKGDPTAMQEQFLQAREEITTALLAQPLALQVKDTVMEWKQSWSEAPTCPPAAPVAGSGGSSALNPAMIQYTE